MQLVQRWVGIARDPREFGRGVWMALGVPALGLALFLGLWAIAAPRIETSLGAVPGPMQVAEQARTLWTGHFNERRKRAEFYERQDKRNAARLKEDPAYQPRQFEWTGKPSYFDQILTSLFTAFAGFLLGTAVAVPLGILAGSSKVVQAAINPIV